VNQLGAVFVFEAVGVHDVHSAAGMKDAFGAAGGPTPSWAEWDVARAWAHGPALEGPAAAVQGAWARWTRLGGRYHDGPEAPCPPPVQDRGRRGGQGYVQPADGERGGSGAGTSSPAAPPPSVADTRPPDAAW